MKKSNFLPPPITPLSVSTVEEIGEQIGALSNNSDLLKQLRLQRVSTVRSVQASLQIEGNTLSVEQVTALLEGKK